MRRTAGVALAFAFALSGVGSARAATGYTDLGSSSWASGAINYTAVQHDWLTVRGTLFGPSGPVTRAMLARAVVLAFPPKPPEVVDPCPDPVPTDVPWWQQPQPSETPSPGPSASPSPSPDPCIPPPPPPPPPLPTFSDLAAVGPTYRYAAQAVQRGSMSVHAGNRFDAYALVTKAEMDRTLVRALNVNDVINAIDRISSEDGYRFRHSSQLAYGVIAARLHFHYNYPGTMKDLVPSSFVTRADFAYALYAAKGTSDWRLWSLQEFKDLKLPKMDPTRRKVVEFALAYAEYPYVWASSSSRGFDCSGFVWWVLKSGIGPPSRGYVGWPLVQRTSYDMARMANPRVLQRDLRPGDIMLFNQGESAGAASWQQAGHAGVSLGNGWYIHSSGGNGGVGINRIGGDRGSGFLWGRHVIPG